MSTANIISCTLHYDFLERQRRLEYRPNVCRMETDSRNNRVLYCIQLSRYGICIEMLKRFVKRGKLFANYLVRLELLKTLISIWHQNGRDIKRKKEKKKEKKSRVINAQYRFTISGIRAISAIIYTHIHTYTTHNITNIHVTHIDNL